MQVAFDRKQAGPTLSPWRKRVLRRSYCVEAWHRMLPGVECRGAQSVTRAGIKQDGLCLSATSRRKTGTCRGNHQRAWLAVPERKSRLFRCIASSRPGMHLFVRVSHPCRAQASRLTWGAEQQLSRLAMTNLSSHPCPPLNPPGSLARWSRTYRPVDSLPALAVLAPLWTHLYSCIQFFPERIPLQCGCRRLG